MPTFLPGEFLVYLLCDLGVNSVNLACCPLRDRQPIWPSSACLTLIGLLSVCRSKQGTCPPVQEPWHSRHLQRYTKILFTISTSLQKAHATGTLCVLVLMYAGTQVFVTVCSRVCTKTLGNLRVVFFLFFLKIS